MGNKVNGRYFGHKEVMNEEHKLIIDEYFANGFNGGDAVRKYRPDLAKGSSAVIFNRIISSPQNLSYIGEKKQALRASVVVKQEHVLHELLNWLRSDATDFLGLTSKEIKELPKEVKRCIQSIQTRITTDKNGNKVENLTVKLVDKVKAIEMINKHIDFYNADNQSKKQTIDLSSATPEQLNTVLQLMDSQMKANQEKTIDIE